MPERLVRRQQKEDEDNRDSVADSSAADVPALPDTNEGSEQMRNIVSLPEASANIT